MQFFCRMSGTVRLLSNLGLMVAFCLHCAAPSQKQDPPDPSSQSSENLSFSDVEETINLHCVPCHRIEDANGGIRFDSYNQVKINAPIAALCVEGKCPDEDLKRMPPGLARWSEQDKALTLRYFKAGAPE